MRAIAAAPEDQDVADVPEPECAELALSNDPDAAAQLILVTSTPGGALRQAEFAQRLDSNRVR